MKPLTLDEILPLPAYERARPGMQAHILEVKERRRVRAGPLTFLFENRDTVRYQIQEMARAERMVRAEELQHEVETYNELLGREGELGCALLIEIEDPGERDRKLRDWLGLPTHLYVELAGGRRVRPTYDPRQVGEDRVSAVQYLRFDVQGQVPVAVGADFPQLTVAATLDSDQRAALAADLPSDA